MAARKLFDTRVFAAFTKLFEVKIEHFAPIIPDTKINVGAIPVERYVSIYPDITVIVRSFPDAPFVTVDML